MSAVIPSWSAPGRAHLVASSASAWLIAGMGQQGQLDFALSVAKAALCLSEAAHTTGVPCDQCDSCHQFDLKTHADLKVIVPEVLGLETGWPLESTAARDVEKKRRKPGQDIRVEAVRDLIAFTQLTPSGPHPLVVVVHPTERLNVVSANTLLKTLEEPPGQTRFILTTQAESRVLPTIKSRCLIHRMARPSDTDAQAWLLDHRVPEAQAVPLLRAAGGQVQTAMALHEAGWTAERWSGLPAALRAGHVQALSDLAMPEVVSVLQKVCHDALSLAQGGAPRYFEAANFPKTMHPWRLSQWAKALTDTARHAQHPYHAGLMLDALVSQAQRALQP